jgi:hypothetical protein
MSKSGKVGSVLSVVISRLVVGFFLVFCSIAVFFEDTLAGVLFSAAVIISCLFIILSKKRRFAEIQNENNDQADQCSASPGITSRACPSCRSIKLEPFDRYCPQCGGYLNPGNEMET